MARRAKDLTLTLHIGLHKTATTFLQNEMLALRHRLLERGVVFPTVGLLPAGSATRDGAQSGHALFTRMGQDYRRLVNLMLEEVPSTADEVLLSSENFTLWHRSATPAQYLQRFAEFGSVRVVIVLRRQDHWIESYYKQIVDGFADYETRSFDAFLAEEGPRLLDYHERFTPWRELVGPENFHVISYNDEPDAVTIFRKILALTGVDADDLVEGPVAADVARYESVRPIDTLGLRILNAFRLSDREQRIDVAKSIYAMAPAGELPLMTEEMRGAIRRVCAPVNARIEEEWFGYPVPGLRFADDLHPAPPGPPAPPSGPDVARYVDGVIAVCEAAVTRAGAATEAAE